MSLVSARDEAARPHQCIRGAARVNGPAPFGASFGAPPRQNVSKQS